jgi:hypothetical protein
MSTSVQARGKCGLTRWAAGRGHQGCGGEVSGRVAHLLHQFLHGLLLGGAGMDEVLARIPDCHARRRSSARRDEARVTDHGVACAEEGATGCHVDQNG